MNKPFKVLVLYYSQTGKTKDVINNFLHPLCDRENILIDEVAIEPVVAYPFPWPKLYFFSIFPECVYEDTVSIKTPVFKESKYDLVILGAQVWFLSISIPIVSFLKSQDSKILKNTKVITVINCRKMWIYTQKRLEEYVGNIGGIVIDKVLVTAQGQQMKTLTFTKDNLFKENGERDRQWKVSSIDLEQLSRQGCELLDAIQSGCLSDEEVFSRKSNSFHNKEFEHPENVARKRFIQAGGLIRRISKPRSFFRYVLTVFFLFFFFIMVFVGLPLWPLVKRLKERKKNSSFSIGK
ncbi:MAG: hypothetical protein L3J88_02195 [Gammaproteobacteria bacterium]|nr:hypothetical protein [Gammaproteobacteria bacterium]